MIFNTGLMEISIPIFWADVIRPYANSELSALTAA